MMAELTGLYRLVARSDHNPTEPAKATGALYTFLRFQHVIINPFCFFDGQIFSGS